ncbi:MAG: LysE family translocator [Alphaproteobacteria bacterium]
MIATTTLLAWTALSVGLAVAPGADTALVATNAARGGVGAGLRAVAGVMTGGLFYVALFGLGLLRLIALTPVLFLTVKIVGAIYLAFLGVQLLRSAFRPTLSLAERVARDSAPGEGRAYKQASNHLSAPHPPTPSPQGRRGAAAPFRQGFLCNMLNPKVALFFLAALPQFVQPGPDAPLFGAALIAISYSIGGLWLCGIALAASRIGAAFRESALSRWIEGAMGVFFLSIAGKLALEER